MGPHEVSSPVGHRNQDYDKFGSRSLEVGVPGMQQLLVSNAEERGNDSQTHVSPTTILVSEPL